MTDFQRLLHGAREDQVSNFETHVNPAFSELLRTLGHRHSFVRGEGALLWDEQGQCYLDCVAGYAVHAIGRSHPRMVNALREALESGHPNWVQFDRPALSGLLARRLSERTGGELQHAVFSNSGSEAVECAFKLARRATGRDAVLHCDHAYHGMTLGALSANGNERLRQPFGDLGPSEQIAFNDLHALERALESRKFAAFIVEPVQGKTCRSLADGYLAEASRLATKHGTILIVDEVQTGVGRTGKFFGYEHDRGARPHMVVLSKALSGGYVPLGVTLVRRDLWRATFHSISNALIHSSTFQGGLLAMVAGLMTLEIHDADQLSSRAVRLGERIASTLRVIQKKYPCIGEVRGKGLICGIALTPTLLERALASIPIVGSAVEPVFAQAFVMEFLKKHRVLCLATERTTNVIKFTPPLALEESQCDWLLRAVEECFHTISRAPTVHGIAHAVHNLGDG